MAISATRLTQGVPWLCVPPRGRFAFFDLDKRDVLLLQDRHIDSSTQAINGQILERHPSATVMQLPVAHSLVRNNGRSTVEGGGTIGSS